MATRGRPKINKSLEDLENDRIKRNEYQKNYHKKRCETDPEYAEKYRLQLNIRTKRYKEKNKEVLKMKRDEITMKAKLYDEMMKNMSV